MYHHAIWNSRNDNGSVHHRADIVLLVLFTKNRKLEEIERKNGYFDPDPALASLQKFEAKKKRNRRILQCVLLCVIIYIFSVSETKKTSELVVDSSSKDQPETDDVAFEDDLAFEDSESEEPHLSEIIYAVLNHDGLRIRKEPSETAELATDQRIHQGEGVYGTGSVSDDGNWVEIYINENSTG